MDASRFDALSRGLSAAPTRRRTLGALAALGVVAVSGRDAAAKKKRGKGKKENGGSRCPKPRCAPNCTGKACGPDGCGGSCGACAGGACRDGVCDCSASRQEVCGGNCVAPCPSGRPRNPVACTCCIPNGQPTSGELCLTGVSDACCSGLCSAATGNCLGSAGTCQFDAQCASNACAANGTCVV